MRRFRKHFCTKIALEVTGKSNHLGTSIHEEKRNQKIYLKFGEKTSSTGNCYVFSDEPKPSNDVYKFKITFYDIKKYLREHFFELRMTEDSNYLEFYNPFGSVIYLYVNETRLVIFDLGRKDPVMLNKEGGDLGTSSPNSLIPDDFRPSNKDEPIKPIQAPAFCFEQLLENENRKFFPTEEP